MLCTASVNSLAFEDVVTDDEVFFLYRTETRNDVFVLLNANSEKLKGDVVIPSQIGGYTVTGIDGRAFMGCKEIESITIPNTVEIIRDEAFLGCYNLKQVILPKSVKKIEKYAFDATLNITDVYYEGSEKDWNNIDIDRMTNVSLIHPINKKHYNYNSDNNDVQDIKNESIISVSLNGSKIGFDVQPQIINDRTMVPLRSIFEALGATVEWDETTQQVTATKNKTLIKLKINEETMYVNDTSVHLDSPACLIEGRTLVPVRAISEALNCQVGYDSLEKHVSIINDTDNFRMLYTLDNRTKAFHKNDINSQLIVGWYEEPVCIIYAPDGRSQVVRTDEVDANLAVGWYTYPVTTMYATDGRAQIVPVSEVEANKAVGWYSTEKEAENAKRYSNPIYDSTREALKECARYVSLVSIDGELLENSIKLYNMNNEPFYLDKVLDDIISINNYFQKIKEISAKSDYLYVLYSGANYEMPVITTTKIPASVSSYASYAKIIKSTYNMLCDYYGGEKLE